MGQGKDLTFADVDFVALPQGRDGEEVGVAFPRSDREAETLRSAYEHGADSAVRELFGVADGNRRFSVVVHFHDGRFTVRDRSGVSHQLTEDQMAKLLLSAGRPGPAWDQQMSLLWLSCELGSLSSSTASGRLRELLKGEVGEQRAPRGRPELFATGGLRLNGDPAITRLGEPEYPHHESPQPDAGVHEGDSVVMASDADPEQVSDDSHDITAPQVTTPIDPDSASSSSAASAASSASVTSEARPSGLEPAAPTRTPSPVQVGEGVPSGTDNGDRPRISEPSDPSGPAAEAPAPRMLSDQAAQSAAYARPAQRSSRDTILAGRPSVRTPIPGGLRSAATQAQAALEQLLRRRDRSFKQFPCPSARLPGSGIARDYNKKNPKGPVKTWGSASWVIAINSQRNEPGTTFLRNCIEASRAFLATWFGVPTAAAGIDGDYPAIEQGSTDRTSEWLETGWRLFEPSGMRTTWTDVERRLQQAGPGSAAIVSFIRQGMEVPEGFSTIPAHSVNAVNYKGTIYWIDAQNGIISRKPLYDSTSDFMAIVLDRDFEPFDPPNPQVDPELAGVMNLASPPSWHSPEPGSQ